jgi:hypothetical protein
MPRKRARKQISLDFNETPKGLCGCDHDHPHSTEKEVGSVEAVVLSFSDKLAQKEQENESRLYDGILSRIKHLNP